MYYKLDNKASEFIEVIKLLNKTHSLNILSLEICAIFVVSQSNHIELYFTKLKIVKMLLAVLIFTFFEFIFCFNLFNILIF